MNPQIRYKENYYVQYDVDMHMYF